MNAFKDFNLPHDVSNLLDKINLRLDDLEGDDANLTPE